MIVFNCLGSLTLCFRIGGRNACNNFFQLHTDGCASTFPCFLMVSVFVMFYFKFHTSHMMFQEHNVFAKRMHHTHRVVRISRCRDDSMVVAVWRSRRITSVIIPGTISIISRLIVGYVHVCFSNPGIPSRRLSMLRWGAYDVHHPSAQ